MRAGTVAVATTASAVLFPVPSCVFWVCRAMMRRTRRRTRHSSPPPELTYLLHDKVSEDPPPTVVRTTKQPSNSFMYASDDILNGSVMTISVKPLRRFKWT